VCRKYQVGGENNEEGLAAGSFWFYDKLGFRSTNKDIRKLADRERKKIAADKSYRTPKKILRRLAEADLVISLKNEPAEKFKEFPLDKAGMLPLKTGAQLCGGDHNTLEDTVHKELKRQFGVSLLGWSAEEKRWATQFGLFVLSVPGIEKWPKQDIKNLSALIKAKGSESEENFIRLFSKNRKFFDALMKEAEKIE
jgi:hypothetical protein